MRLAADFYNLGVTLGLSAKDEPQVILEAGDRALPFGRLDLTVDQGELQLGRLPDEPIHPRGEFEVRGLATDIASREWARRWRRS